MVTVWKREAEKAEVQELGYLSVLQQREPTHTFRHDLNTFKAQGTNAHKQREKTCCGALHGLILLVILVIDDRRQYVPIHNRQVNILEENNEEDDVSFLIDL